MLVFLQPADCIVTGGIAWSRITRQMAVLFLGLCCVLVWFAFQTRFPGVQPSLELKDDGGPFAPDPPICTSQALGH